MEAGQVGTWLKERGYPPEYVTLGPPHGEIVHDRVHAKFVAVMRMMYECESCGRLWVAGADGRYLEYRPESGQVNGIFAD